MKQTSHKYHQMKKRQNSSFLKRYSGILIGVMMIAGIGFLLYPTVADWWNGYHASRAIASYSDLVKRMDQRNYQEMLDEASRYNRELTQRGINWHMTKKDLKRYDQLLNVDQNGLMGYITIPKIGVNLPIYHGTGEAVLQRAIGHIEGSSLPVGGQGSHCIVSGHRGLPSAKLFTHLDELELADQFILHVLDETYYYEVDDIQVIEPTDLEALEIDPEKDYCTLVTCTPYGINTHRLLVRGHRIEDAGLTIQEDAVMVEKRILAPLVVLPFLIILCMNLLMERLMRKKKTKEDLL